MKEKKMNPQTGEIAFFESKIPKGWVGLEELKEGKEITLCGLTFKITKSIIQTGNPGKVELNLEGIPTSPLGSFYNNATIKNETPTVRDAMKAYKERTKKKEWE